MLSMLGFAAPGQEEQAGYYDHMGVPQVSPGRRVQLVEFRCAETAHLQHFVSVCCAPGQGGSASDHLKAILAKTGARTRQLLLARGLGTR